MSFVQITTAVLFGTGDVVAQQVVDRRGISAHDWVRTARLSLYGGAIFAPIVTNWSVSSWPCSIYSPNSHSPFAPMSRYKVRPHVPYPPCCLSRCRPLGLRILPHPRPPQSLFLIDPAARSHAHQVKTRPRRIQGLSTRPSYMRPFLTPHRLALTSLRLPPSLSASSLHAPPSWRASPSPTSRKSLTRSVSTPFPFRHSLPPVVQGHHHRQLGKSLDAPAARL